jgi:hypothetical protein
LGVGGEKQETKLYFCYDPNYLENDSICAGKKKAKMLTVVFFGRYNYK